MSIGSDPLVANRYSYVNGDPINSTDLAGHILEECASGEYVCSRSDRVALVPDAEATVVRDQRRAVRQLFSASSVGLGLVETTAREVAGGIDWGERAAEAFADLVERVREGDPEAVAEFRRLYGDELFLAVHTTTSYRREGGVGISEDETAFFRFSGAQLLGTDAFEICEDHGGPACELAFWSLRREIGIGEPISGGGSFMMPTGPLAAVLEAQGTYTSAICDVASLLGYRDLANFGGAIVTGDDPSAHAKRAAISLVGIDIAEVLKQSLGTVPRVLTAEAGLVATAADYLAC